MDSVRVKDSAGNTTAMGYNVRGFKVAMADPDLGSWSYGYDSLGQLTTQTDAKGQITTLAYDALGRMTSRVEKTNSTTTESTTSWYYDELASSCPEVAESDRRSVAERAVRSLLTTNCVELYERSKIGGKERLVPRTRWDELLSNEANWNEPFKRSTEVLIGATSTGEKLYAMEVND